MFDLIDDGLQMLLDKTPDAAENRCLLSAAALNLKRVIRSLQNCILDRRGRKKQKDEAPSVEVGLSHTN